MGIRPTHSRPRRKPSLYEEDPEQALLAADPGGMLSALEAPRQARRKFTAFATLVLVITLSAIGWQWQGSAVHTVPAAPPSSPPSPQESVRAPATIAAGPAAQSAEVMNVPGAATLIAEKQERPPLSPASVPVATASAHEVSHASSQAGMASGAAPPAVAASRENAFSKKMGDASVVMSVSAAGLPADVSRVSPETVPGSARRGKSHADRDVDLIAALLSRISPESADAKMNVVSTAPAAALARPAGTRKTRPSLAQKSSGKQAFSEALVAQAARCNALSLFEAELCRLRICSGEWGKVPGCPEYAQARQEFP